MQAEFSSLAQSYDLLREAMKLALLKASDIGKGPAQRFAKCREVLGHFTAASADIVHDGALGPLLALA
jgi:hypothetical protein